MVEITFLKQATWRPFAYFGLSHSFFTLNATTLINTWIVLFLLITFICIGRYFLKKENSVVRYLLLTNIQTFMNLTEQTLGTFIYHHFAFIFSLFIFILLCNCISIIPHTTEPTQDINTALALGLISFFYKEWYTIKAHGILGYLKEFLMPFFIMLPVNIIGHFSKIISISFRLFGNIFGGSVIMEIYKAFIGSSIIFQITGILTGMNFLILLFFGVFEGMIQAFVFTMLTLTYLALAIQEEPSATGD